MSLNSKKIAKEGDTQAGMFDFYLSKGGGWGGQQSSRTEDLVAFYKKASLLIQTTSIKFPEMGTWKAFIVLSLRQKP